MGCSPDRRINLMRKALVGVLLLLSCERFHFTPPPSRPVEDPPEGVSGTILLFGKLGEDHGTFFVRTDSLSFGVILDLPGADEVYPKDWGGAVVLSSNAHGSFGIFRYDGDTATLHDPPADQLWPTVSPSGRYVAFVTFHLDDGGNVALYDRSTGLVQVWYDGTDTLSFPVFLDDRHILAVRNGGLEVFSLDSLTWSPVVRPDGIPTYLSLSPDGRTLAFVEASDSFRIRVLPLSPPYGSRTLIALPDSVRGLAWSPDGVYLAFGYGGGIYLADTSSNLYLLMDSVGTVWVSDWK